MIGVVRALVPGAVLAALAADWPRFEPRVRAVDGPAGSRSVVQVQGVTVTTYRTRHGSSETPPNVMYLVDAGGWRLFHFLLLPGMPTVTF